MSLRGHAIAVPARATIRVDAGIVPHAPISTGLGRVEKIPMPVAPGEVFPLTPRVSPTGAWAPNVSKRCSIRSAAQTPGLGDPRARNTRRRVRQQARSA